MPNFLLSIGLALVAFLGALMALWPKPTAPVETPVQATSTVAVIPVVPSVAPAPASPEVVPAAESKQEETITPKTAPATEPVKIPAPKKPTAPTTPTETPVATTTVPEPQPLPSSGNASFDTAAAHLRDALVNIVCYVPAGSGLHSISGSGVFVDTKGIIITNAHIAQYFLLGDRGASCTVRTGTPAQSRYKAALIYISPPWLQANANVLTQALPMGTGEFDFAFIAVTGSATKDPLPASFPAMPIASLPPAAGTSVVIGSYGAQFLQASQIESALFPTIVFGSVKDVYTFDTNTIDVFSLGGSAAAQEGSSGGGIVDINGSLIGTITTSTVQGSTDTRTLSAISSSYIRSEYARETGSLIDALFAQPISVSVQSFSMRIPTLESIITAQLN